MSSILQVFRFVIGLGLVVAGCLLAAPFVSEIIKSAQPPQEVWSKNGPVNGNGSVQPNHSAGVFTVPGMVVAPAALSAGASHPSRQSPRLIPFVAEPESKSSMKPTICPDPMPQTPKANRPPGLIMAYRSTVEVPPPPLLDAMMTPPARLASSGHRVVGEPMRPIPGSIPNHYRIKDGDDLTGIATQLYGHPRGATVLWQANADRLDNPALLPIGMSLDVPPAWEVFGADQVAAGRGQQIEPVSSVVPVGTAMLKERSEGGETIEQPVSSLTPWLGHPPAFQPAVPRAVSPPSRGSLRVTTGETLGSIAQRVYGDDEMAAMIFAVNRDRLRSPDLLVPGMELRLP